MRCPSKDSVDDMQKMSEIKAQTISENIAYKVWHLNKGNTLDLAPNGKPSLLLQSIRLNMPEVQLKEHYVIKSYIYSDEFLKANGNWFLGQKFSKLQLDVNGEPIMDISEFSTLIYNKRKNANKEGMISYVDKLITLSQKQLTPEQLDVVSDFQLQPFTDKAIIDKAVEKVLVGTRFARREGSKVKMVRTISKNDKLYSEYGTATFTNRQLELRFNRLQKKLQEFYSAEFNILELNKDFTITINPMKDMLFSKHMEKVIEYNKRQEYKRNASLAKIEKVLKARTERLVKFKQDLEAHDDLNFMAAIGTTEEVAFNLDMEEGSFKEERVNQPEKLIRALEDRIKQLKSRLTGNLPTVEKDILRLRINSLTEDLRILGTDLSHENVAITATRQLDEIQNIINNKDNLNHADLLNALSIANLWKWENSLNFLTEEQRINKYNDFNIVFNEVSGRAEGLTIDLLDKIIKLLAINVKEDTNVDIDLDNLLDQGSSNVLIDLFLNPSKSKSDLTQYAFIILTQASKNQVGLLDTILKRVDSMFELLGGNVDYSKYWQKNENGEATGRMVSKYSNLWGAYIDHRKTSMDNLYKLYNNNKIDYSTFQARLHKLNEDYRKNVVIIDNDALFNGAKPKMDSKLSRKQYVDYLNKVLGVELTERLIQEAKLKELQYTTDRELYHNQLKDENRTPEDVAEQLKIWELQHSPYEYVNNVYGVKTEFKTRNDGYRYAVSAPKVNNIYGVKTGFYDNTFLDIMSDPNSAEFYMQYNQLMDELKEMLPEDVSDSLIHNMLPNVQRTLMENIVKSGLFNNRDKISEKLMSYVTSPDVVKLTKNKKNTKVDSDYSIPLPFIGNDSVDERSMDLHKIIKMFAGMAVNFRFKSEVEDKALLAYRVLSNQAKVELDSTGQKILNAVTNTKDSGQSMSIRALGHQLNSTLYGVTRENNEGVGKKITTLNPLVNLHGFSEDFKPLNNIKAIKNKKRRIELEQLSAKLEEQLDENAISDVEYAKQLKLLEDEYQSLGGKNLSIISIADSAIKWTQLKSLGLNLPAGIANLLFGIGSNFTHANGRVDFNIKSLFKANALILKEITSRKSGKISKLVEKFDILFDVIDSRYEQAEEIKGIVGKSTKAKVIKKVTSFNPYMFQTKGEYFIQSASFIAHMLFTKVEGTDISVYDAYNEDGTWNESLFDDTTNKDWSNVLESAKSRTAFTKFRDKSIEINKMLHGDYDPDSKILIKRFVVGRLLMQFRSWMPEGIASRFLGERHNMQLDRTTKGRYITYWELGAIGSIKTLGKQLLYHNNPDKAFAALEAPVDIENMRKNLSELMVAATFTGMLILLEAGIRDTDDDEDVTKRRLLYLLYNKVNRAMLDIYFYINPTSAFDILQSPIPALRAFQDLGKAVNRSRLYMFDDNYQGYSPAYYWGKNVPYLNQYYNLQFTTTHVLGGKGLK